jgi:hypothetical protein
MCMWQCAAGTSSMAGPMGTTRWELCLVPHRLQYASVAIEDVAQVR